MFTIGMAYIQLLDTLSEIHGYARDSEKNVAAPK